MKRGPSLLNTIFVGDRVADVARSLGCYPKAMVGGQVPMIETEYPFVCQLDCVLCIMGAKRKMLLNAYRKMDIDYVVLERTGGDPDPSGMAAELEAEGLAVRVLDFTRGLEHAIAEAGGIFGREKEAVKVAAEYGRQLEAAQANLPRPGKRVLVLLGISRPGAGAQERYLLAETPGGFVDTALLAPLGCENVAGPLLSPTEETVMGGIQLLREFKGLEEANPDAIALTGDPLVGLLALRDFAREHPGQAARIPALRDHAVYALPHCCDANPMSYPHSLALWGQALAG